MAYYSLIFLLFITLTICIVFIYSRNASEPNCRHHPLGCDSIQVSILFITAMSSEVNKEIPIEYSRGFINLCAGKMFIY